MRAQGWAAAGEPAPSPHPVWHQRAPTPSPTLTHGMELPAASMCVRADTVTHADMHLGWVTHALLHTTRHVHVCTHMKLPPGTCHPCEHPPSGTDLCVKFPKCICLDPCAGSPRSPPTPPHMVPGNPGASPATHPAQATPSCSPGPWAAGPTQQRWTGAGTGSECGLLVSPASGSSRCPSPLSWHLWSQGRGGVIPSPILQPHPRS